MPSKLLKIVLIKIGGKLLSANIAVVLSFFTFTVLPTLITPVTRPLPVIIAQKIETNMTLINFNRSMFAVDLVFQMDRNVLLFVMI